MRINEGIYYTGWNSDWAALILGILLLVAVLMNNTFRRLALSSVGEVDWPTFFTTLDRLGFDGNMTACVFAWEERAAVSCVFMRKEMDRYVSTWRPRP